MFKPQDGSLAFALACSVLLNIFFVVISVMDIGSRPPLPGKPAPDIPERTKQNFTLSH